MQDFNNFPRHLVLVVYRDCLVRPETDLELWLNEELEILLRMGNSQGLTGRALRGAGFTPQMAGKIGMGMGVLGQAVGKVTQAFGAAAIAAGGVIIAFELFKKLNGVTERLTTAMKMVMLQRQNELRKRVLLLIEPLPLGLA